MEIKPVYVFYGEDRGRIQMDVDFFRGYFLKEGCFVDTFDGAKDPLSEILMAAEANPLFGEKRLIIVNNAPWFGGKKKGTDSAKTKKADPEETQLLAYLAEPNPDICMVFLCGTADKRKKAAKTAEQCGTLREYKVYKRWELPEYIRKCCRKAGKGIHGRTIDLLIAVVGEDTAILASEIEKLALFLDERKTIEEDDVLRVASHSAEADSFQLSDALGNRDLVAVASLGNGILTEMKPGEYMALFGYLTNYIRLLMRVKALDQKHMSEDMIAKTLGIHAFRIKKGIPAARRYTMKELADAINAFAEVELAMKSGRREFKEAFLAALLNIAQN